MKFQSLLSALFFCLCLQATAQSNDATLMTINGRPVTVGEFKYSYNKNGNIDGAVEQKTVEEYVDMFVNYKLKVAAALDAHLDTLTSFRKEFLQYRDMQLTPYLVDEAFIDSVARTLYQRTCDRLKGQDMLRVAHILIPVKQQAGDDVLRAAERKADSLYRAATAGADFGELARSNSADKGTAAKGGELPWIGPGMTLKEFETVAYALKPGEVSRPLKSPVGVHIIKMLERKQLEPYDTLKPQIVAGLKRQGYEEASAENRIGKIVAASHGRLTREAVLDSVLEANIKNNEDLRYLVQEYHDGLLLYEISKKNVWDKVANDKEQLKALFKKNKKKYAWSEPRFRGFVYHMKEEGLGRQVKKVLKKNAEGDWRAALKREINKDSIIVRVSGPYLCKKGENSYIDQLEFDGPAAKPMTGFPYFGVYGKVLKRPKDYTDVKSQVESYYQELLEKEWVDRLHTQFPFEVNRSLLETIK